MSSLALLLESAEHTPARAGVTEFERHSHGPWRTLGWLTLGIAADVAIVLVIAAL
ncbi:MAG: hypothetical protein ACKVWV_11630 [Planctomycetota bacterium]